jgi:hypothetical protein
METLSQFNNQEFTGEIKDIMTSLNLVITKILQKSQTNDNQDINSLNISDTQHSLDRYKKQIQSLSKELSKVKEENLKLLNDIEQ